VRLCSVEEEHEEEEGGEEEEKKEEEEEPQQVSETSMLEGQAPESQMAAGATHCLAFGEGPTGGGGGGGDGGGGGQIIPVTKSPSHQDLH
jgi:hypothetical protein